jgi:hypothetical protein
MSGQRVWKAQPGGTFVGLGNSPLSITRCLARCVTGFASGTADINARE